MIKYLYLIKRGGGTGPVKPGNRRKFGAKSCGASREMSRKKQLVPRRGCAAGFLFWEVEYEEAFYFGVCYGRAPG